MIVFKLITQSDRTNSKNEVTRWVYRDELTSKTWDALVERLKQLFGTRSSQFFVSWFDGTDYCTIRDVHDLREAINGSHQSNAKEAAVRVFVSKDKKEHQTIFGFHADYDPESLTDAKLGDEPRPVEETKPRDPTTETPQPVQSETGPVAAATNPVLQPVSPHPIAPFVPYAVQYPYGQFYRPIPPTTMYSALPSAMLHPDGIPHTEASTKLNGAGATDVVNTMCRHETTLIPEPGNTFSPPVQNKTSPNLFSAKTIAINKVNWTKQLKRNEDFCIFESAVKASKSYVPLAINTLRQMGYQQDEKELMAVVKAFKGDLSYVVEYLEKYSKR